MEVTLRTRSRRIIIGKFAAFFIRFLPFFEALIPVLISFFLRWTLGGWKKRGLIENFSERTVRMSRFNYDIELRVFLTKKQARNALNDLINELLRWVESQLNQLIG